jgi:hypothetical protein
MSEFKIKLSRPGRFGEKTAATLEMPTTWSEHREAEERARVTNFGIIYKAELLEIKREYLKPYIKPIVDTLELNLFAQRLSELDKRQHDRLKEMVGKEKISPGYDPERLPRLINMTYNLDKGLTVPDVFIDELLGKYLYENNLLSRDDYETIGKITESPGSDARLFFQMLGMKRRIAEDGSYNGKGYFEKVKPFEKVYIPGKMTYFNRTGPLVALEISKGHFNDPDYDNNLTASLNLPEVYGNEILKALETVQAASLKEIGYTCTDCLIPAAKEWINDADDINSVIEFAKDLEKLERNILPVQYKALLEAAGCDNLDTAMWLIEEADEYELDSEPEIQEDIDYDTLENFAVTLYGNLRRKDGEPIPSYRQDSSGHAMQM